MTSRDRGASSFIYNQVTLRLYDLGVLGFTNSAIWRCPTTTLAHNYRHVRNHHLDIGPGTGYYLQDIGATHVSLLDLNTASLAMALRRTPKPTATEIIHQSYFASLGDQQWDSIALNFVLHCIPDHAKWERLAQLIAHLRPGGVLFGSTIITDKTTATMLSRSVASAYQRLGVFGNQYDTRRDLEQALEGFVDVSIIRRGQCLLFSAYRAQA